MPYNNTTKVKSMTSKEVFDRMGEALRHEQPGRLQSVQRALNLGEFIPKHAGRVGKEHAAWILTAVAMMPPLAPERGLEWLRTWSQRWYAAARLGHHTLPGMLADLLGSPEAAEQVSSIMIDCDTGATAVQLANGSIASAPPISDVNDELLSIRQTTVIRGRLVSELATALAAAEIEELVQQN